jgi:hypothetical protein
MELVWVWLVFIKSSKITMGALTWKVRRKSAAPRCEFVFQWEHEVWKKAAHPF